MKAYGLGIVNNMLKAARSIGIEPYIEQRRENMPIGPLRIALSDKDTDLVCFARPENLTQEQEDMHVNFVLLGVFPRKYRTLVRLLKGEIDEWGRPTQGKGE